MLIVQGDAFNRSALATAVCVPLTSKLEWARAPGNVLFKARETGLHKDSVANVSQLVSVDRDLLTERAGRVPHPKLHLVLTGIDIVLGRK